MSGAVIDASALIALLRSEPGADVVAQHLRGSSMSAVNLCEVLEHAPRSDHTADRVIALLHSWQVEIIPFELSQARAASALKSAIDSKADISFADRACLALAASRSLPALTADRKWKSLAIGVEIILVRGELN